MFIPERIIASIAPHYCLGCGAEGSVVCDWCRPDFASPVPERCYRCQVQTENSRICAKCRRYVRMRHVWVRTLYEGPAKQLIHDFKFERKQAAAEPIARLMTEALPYIPFDTVVTHVPTASGRVRQRGYDHAQLIAKRLAAETGLPYAPLLVRTTQTRQVRATRAERLTQLQGAFKPPRPQAIKGARILLVDDIVTTGGTLLAATTALRHAGAKMVDAVVFAQKV